MSIIPGCSIGQCSLVRRSGMGSVRQESMTPTLGKKQATEIAFENNQGLDLTDKAFTVVTINMFK